MMAGLAGAAPLAAFLVLWSLTTTFVVRPQCQGIWRLYAEAFLYAALAWGVCVTVLTEGLSTVHALTAAALALCWLTVSLAGVGLMMYVTWRHRHARTSATITTPEKMPVTSNTVEVTPTTVASLEQGAGVSVWYISLAFTAIILVVTGFVAWITPPNNWDAMTYHLARVQHWIQNQSVDFYPTNDTRQLFDPPWAEYALLQFQLLTGGDHLANFVQWFSSLGTCAAVPLITQRLGANRAGQGLAMVLAAATPMAILQSSSPQNDFVTSFWLVCCVYFALRFARSRGVVDASALGVAVGLATLTKATAYIFVAPIVLGLALWLVMHRSRSHRGAGWPWGSTLGQLCIAGLLVLVLNGPQYARNMATFHSPLGPDSAAYANQTFAPTALTCNAARTISLELGVSSAALNAALYQHIVDICNVVGVSANDPRITWTGQGGLPFRINPANTYEGTAGNLAQFALIVLALALALALSRLRSRRLIALYATLLLLGFVLFVCYLRWQPWGNRLLLPWFMSAAPLVGVVLDRLFARRFSLPLLELALLVLAAPYLLLNRNAPLLGTSTALNTPRVTQYFVTNQGLEQPYRDAARYVNQRGCLAVGFHGPVEGWEYPFWLLIGAKPYQAHIEHLLVDNASARFTSDQRYQRFHPCAIINVLAPSDPEPAVVTFHGTVYRPTWTEAMVVVYVPDAR